MTYEWNGLTGEQMRLKQVTLAPTDTNMMTLETQSDVVQLILNQRASPEQPIKLTHRQVQQIKQMGPNCPYEWGVASGCPDLIMGVPFEIWEEEQHETPPL